MAEAEERAWERIKGRIDELVTERASERLRNADERAKVAVKREKVLKRTLDLLWTVLRRVVGKCELETIKSAHEAALSEPKTFKFEGLEGP